MGTRGRVPNPNAQRRNIKMVTSIIEAKRPEHPREMGGEALAEWKRVVDCLMEMGAMHTADRALLIQHCTLWAEWVEVDAQLKKSGRLVNGPNGLESSPLWKLRRELSRDLVALAPMIGHTPAARLRSGVLQGDKPKAKPVVAEPAAPTPAEDPRRLLRMVQ